MDDKSNDKSECPSPTTIACPSPGNTDSNCPGENKPTVKSHVDNPVDKPGHTALGMIVAAPAIAAIAIPNTQAQGYLDAANIFVEYIEPTLTQIKNFYAKINSINDTSIQKKETQIANKGLEDSFKILLSTANEKMKGKNVGVEELLKINTDLQNDIKTLINSLNPPKGGGKKIISRTHKSINQFLNPKITAANMLKSKKRFRNNKSKSKSKYKSKKRMKY